MLLNNFFDKKITQIGMFAKCGILSVLTFNMLHPNAYVSIFSILFSIHFLWC